MTARTSLSHVDAAAASRWWTSATSRSPTRSDRARIDQDVARGAARRSGRGAVKKGDPLQAARLAGIMAAKQTSALIPLCHPLPMSSVHVELTPTARGYDIEARVRTAAQTGVEMEALTAVAVAALTIYDMVKAVDKAMVIGDIRLDEEDRREERDVSKTQIAGLQDCRSQDCRANDHRDQSEILQFCNPAIAS